MAKGVSLQQISSVLGKALKTKNITPAQIITKEGIGVARTASLELFGYDFIGLGIKLLVYFIVAFAFAKFMEAVIFARGIWVILAQTLGFSIPKADMFPDSLKKLFGGGISGFKFWDIVKIVAVLLVIAEFFRYLEANKKAGSKSSPMTMGIFVGIIGMLGIVTVPELIKRLKVTDFNLDSLR